MSSNDEYERIALSKQDLRFLYNQILKSVTSRLDLNIPTTNNDPFKREVANALDDFLMGGFDMAKSALIVDGRDMSRKPNSKLSIADILSLKPKEKVEDFDVAINAKLREVLLQVEEITTEVTALRRELPHKAKITYDNLVTKVDKQLTDILLQIDASIPGENTEVEIEDTELANDYLDHIMKLDELKKSIPRTKAELGKLDSTIQFLEDAYKQQQEEGS